MDGHIVVVHVQEAWSNLTHQFNFCFESKCTYLLCVHEDEDFEVVESQLQTIERACEFRPLPVIIVSTMSDLHGDAVQNAKRRAVRLAREHGCEWMSCSAATGEGVQEVFEKAIRMNMFYCYRMTAKIIDDTLQRKQQDIDSYEKFQEHSLKQQQQQQSQKCNIM